MPIGKIGIATGGKPVTMGTPKAGDGASGFKGARPKEGED